MRVDVWSDVVCPWCYIGFTRLDKALEQFGKPAEVYHHAFQLDPNASGEPVNAAQHLAEKYGVGVEDALGMMAAVTETAAGDGLHYELAATKHGNTRLAHRLLAFAATKGVQHELLLLLFNAYFERGKDVFSAEELMPFALAAGLNESEVSDVFSTDAFSDVIDYDRNLAEQINIRGVPFFIFNERVAVAGAESIDTMLQAMRRSEELKAESQ